jgi:hypothetical protein
MEQSLTSEATSSASQEISPSLWNPNVHYRIHNSPLHIPVPRQMNPVHAPIPHQITFLQDSF